MLLWFRFPPPPLPSTHNGSTYIDRTADDGLQLLFTLDLSLAVIIAQGDLGLPLLRSARSTDLALVLQIRGPEGGTDGGGQGKDDRDDRDDVKGHGDGSETDVGQERAIVSISMRC